MKSNDKPYILHVAEKIYLEISKIKKKIIVFQILMPYMHLLDQKYIMKLVMVNFMMNGLNNWKMRQKKYLMKH